LLRTGLSGFHAGLNWAIGIRAYTIFALFSLQRVMTWQPDVGIHVYVVFSLYCGKPITRTGWLATSLARLGNGKPYPLGHVAKARSRMIQRSRAAQMSQVLWGEIGTRYKGARYK
jgi:hypothetical protein